MIAIGTEQADMPLGWALSEEWYNPDEHATHLVWRGPVVSLQEAIETSEVSNRLLNKSYTRQISVAGCVAEFEVILPDSYDAGIEQKPEDVAPATYSIEPVEFDIPCEQRYILDVDSASNLAWLPAMEAALRSADTSKLDKWWDQATETMRRVAYWRICGVKSYRGHSYNLSLTRYMRKTSVAAKSLYDGVGKVVAWDGLRSYTGGVISSTFPEPVIQLPSGKGSTTLQWLIRPPRITLRSKWLEVSQLFIGSIRFPADFYPGGSWQSNVGPLKEESSNA